MFKITFHMPDDLDQIHWLDNGTVELQIDGDRLTDVGWIVESLSSWLSSMRQLLQHTHWQTHRFQLTNGTIYFVLKWRRQAPEMITLLYGNEHKSIHKTMDVVKAFQDAANEFVAKYGDKIHCQESDTACQDIVQALHDELAFFNIFVEQFNMSDN